MSEPQGRRDVEVVECDEEEHDRDVEPVGVGLQVEVPQVQEVPPEVPYVDPLLGPLLLPHSYGDGLLRVAGGSPRGLLPL